MMNTATYHAPYEMLYESTAVMPTRSFYGSEAEAKRTAEHYISLRMYTRATLYLNGAVIWSSDSSVAIAKAEPTVMMNVPKSQAKLLGNKPQERPAMKLVLVPGSCDRERANRAAVAEKLATVLDALSCSAEIASVMGEPQWILAAKAAKVKLPSAQTRTLVVTLLGRMGR